MPIFNKTTRYNRFNQPKTIKVNDSYTALSFTNSLKSYKSNELFFTNFVKTENNQCYLWIKKYLNDAKSKNFSFIEREFGFLEDIKYTEPSAKRLLEIINKGYNHRYKPNDLKNIFELKHNENKKFHLFIYKNRDILNVILIDFFHLGLNADLILFNGSRKKITNKEIFNKQELNSWDLSNLLK